MIVPDVFTVALLKGAVEGDVGKHFGSFLGLAAHTVVARRCGLVESDGVTPTEYGLDVYVRHGVDSLPDGRAYLVWTRACLVDHDVRSRSQMRIVATSMVPL